MQYFKRRGSIGIHGAIDTARLDSARETTHSKRLRGDDFSPVAAAALFGKSNYFLLDSFICNCIELEIMELSLKQGEWKKRQNGKVDITSSV
jgi:hypothetical protein